MRATCSPAIFFMTVTGRFRLLYVFVVLDVWTRRLLHWNVTEHPTAEWTVQQFRTWCDQRERPSLRGARSRHNLCASSGPRLEAMGLRVLIRPIGASQADAYCERVIGTAVVNVWTAYSGSMRRHLRRVVAEWVLITSRSSTLEARPRSFPTRHRPHRGTIPARDSLRSVSPRDRFWAVSPRIPP